MMYTDSNVHEVQTVDYCIEWKDSGERAIIGIGVGLDEGDLETSLYYLKN